MRCADTITPEVDTDPETHRIGSDNEKKTRNSKSRRSSDMTILKKFLFKVVWKNYPLNAATWESEENLGTAK